jgi:xylulokinase
MLAGVGAGTFRDLDEAVDRLTVLEPVAYEPDVSTAAAYDEAYDRYRRLFDALEPGFEGIAAGRRAGRDTAVLQ